MKNIRNTMMLGQLSIGTWNARVTDKTLARKVEDEAKAKNGTATAGKKLMAGAVEFERVQKEATAHRNWWASQTVPWFDNGLRAYNAARHMDLMTEVGDRRREWMGYVDEFIRVYPNLRAQREFDMGDLFDPKDFPTPDVIREKFYFKVDVLPVPNQEDIRIIDALPQEEVDRMIEEVRERDNARTQTAMRDAATRLLDAISKVHAKLSVKVGDPGSIFRDSMIENIAQLVEVMPALNIINDPELDKLTKEAKKFALYSPDQLREDETHRAKVAGEAKKLADKLAGLFDSE